MRIGIDARFWGPGHTGLGVYTQQLVENLAKIDNKNKYFVFLRKEAMKLVNLPNNFHQVEVDAPAYSLKEQILVPLTLYRIRPDLVHFTSINIPVLYFGKYLTTIHDLIKHHSKGKATTTHAPFIYWLKYFLYLVVSWWAVHSSQKILVPSKDVRKKLINYYQLSPEKIKVTYEAAVVSVSGSQEKVSLPPKFAIYTGNAYPHKNLEHLIASWKEVYQRTGTKLAIACGRSVFTQKFESLIRERDGEEFVVFLGYPSNSQLRFAYHRAEIFVSATLMEGFGIPGLDAMNLNLPVVCSDIPVLREIYGQAAHYFDPGDEKDITIKVIEVLTNEELRKKLISLGKQQAAKYSWRTTARETLTAYESCLGLRPR